MKKERLIVTSIDENGNIDTTNYQELSAWNEVGRRINLLIKAYGYNLIDILKREFGLQINEYGLFNQPFIVTTHDYRTQTMQWIGRIAEVLIVEECKKSTLQNKKWGKIARKGKNIHKTLDLYEAIGTGFNSTKNNHISKYNPNDTQRDIIWINKEEPTKELLQIGNNQNQKSGLQVKASISGLANVINRDVTRGKYEVPIVYFDLNDDYHDLTNAIYKENNGVVIGQDIVRGKEISPTIHDELISYYWLIYNIISGKENINNWFNKHKTIQKEIKKTVKRRDNNFSCSSYLIKNTYEIQRKIAS